VKLQLGGIFAGFAARSGKPKRERFVDQLAILGITDAGEGGLAGFRNAADQLLQRNTAVRAGDPHHRNRRRRPTGGEGEDGVVDVRHQSSFWCDLSSYSQRRNMPVFFSYQLQCLLAGRPVGWQKRNVAHHVRLQHHHASDPPHGGQARNIRLAARAA
jgi:hypothetical protein